MKKLLILIILLTSCSKPIIKYVEEVSYIEIEQIVPSNFISPMEQFKISSKFGFRTHPLGGEEFDLHKGIDLVGPKDAPIYAVKGGKVAVHFPPPDGYFKGHPVFGGLIIIHHKEGIYTLYGHLKKSFIKEGQDVFQGEIIGVQGSTGASTGPHLHFEILLDPEIVLTGRIGE